jgi:lipoprotein-anchoring transpeptidase ErfK/SrfK
MRAEGWETSMRKAIQSFAVIAALQAGVWLALPAPAQALTGYEPGTIVIKTSERKLYYVLGNGQSRSYPVAVGRTGKTWTGVTTIEGKFLSPAWSPPAEIRRDKPNIPDVIPGGAPNNPMGAAAMTLSGGGEYAIHGTNAPGSIGRSASYGCIRMHNRDIMDLYQRVSVGTRVIVEQ